MKVLLKKEVCEFREQYMGLTRNTPQPHNMHLIKKKKEKKMQAQDTAFSSVPKRVVNIIELLLLCKES